MAKDNMSSPSPEERSWLDELLDELGERSAATLAELQAQDPLDIDVVERLPWLSGEVLNWLFDIRADLSPQSRAAIEDWKESQRQWMRRLRESAEIASQRFQDSLPPNWQDPDIEFPSVEELEQLQLSEGLPLAWVPPTRVLGLLLDASSLEERHSIIRDESAAILSSCVTAVESLRDPRLADWKAAALEAVEALQAGFLRAGQALATVALDSAIAEFVTNSYQHGVSQTVNGKATPPGTLPTSLPTWNDVDHPRALLVFYGLWGAHRRYWKKHGDEVPGIYSRHATVHTMSDRQYTTTNALIAVMHLIALLCMLDEMMNQQRAELAAATSPN